MTDTEDLGADERQLILTAQIVTAYVARNPLQHSALPGLIETVYRSLQGQPAPPPPPLPPTPEEARQLALRIRQSISTDYLICLEDGQRVTMLKRYLAARYQLTPQAYRQKWDLPQDYPMVAPAYAARRSELAKASGLGRPRHAKSNSKLFQAAMGPTPRPRGRPRKQPA